MRITRGVVFGGCFVAQIRDSGFASITFNHELKVGRVSLSEQNQEVLWSGIFRVVTTQNKNVFLVARNKNVSFCGQEFLGFWLFRTKNGTFCGQEFFGLGRFVARNISRRTVLWPGILANS